MANQDVFQQAGETIDPGKFTAPGPFSDMLSNAPVPVEPFKAQNQWNTGWQKGIGGAAQLLGNFLEGIGKGRVQKYAQEQAREQQQMKLVEFNLNTVLNNPAASPQAKQDAIALAKQSYLAAMPEQDKGHKGEQRTFFQHLTDGIRSVLEQGSGTAGLPKAGKMKASDFAQGFDQIQAGIEDPKNTKYNQQAIVGQLGDKVNAAIADKQKQRGPAFNSLDLSDPTIMAAETAYYNMMGKHSPSYQSVLATAPFAPAYDEAKKQADEFRAGQMKATSPNLQWSTGPTGMPVASRTPLTQRELGQLQSSGMAEKQIQVLPVEGVNTPLIHVTEGVNAGWYRLDGTAVDAGKIGAKPPAEKKATPSPKTLWSTHDGSSMLAYKGEDGKYRDYDTNKVVDSKAWVDTPPKKATAGKSGGAKGGSAKNASHKDAVTFQRDWAHRDADIYKRRDEALERARNGNYAAAAKLLPGMDAKTLESNALNLETFIDQQSQKALLESEALYRREMASLGGTPAPATGTEGAAAPPSTMTDFAPVYVAPGPAPQGLTKPGNIDLSKQPKVHNPDGTTSTVDSVGVELDGKHLLLSRVTPDGKHLTTEQAIDYYKKTGKNLGEFKDDAGSNAYGSALHKAYEDGKIRGYPAQDANPLQ